MKLFVYKLITEGQPTKAVGILAMNGTVAREAMKQRYPQSDVNFMGVLDEVLQNNQVVVM